MSDPGKKAQMQTFAAGFAGFAGVVALGSFAILHQGGAAVKAPEAVYASVDMPAPLRIAKPGLSGAPVGGAPADSSPAPLPPDEARADGGSAGGSAASSRTGKRAKLVVGRHLDGSSSASSSAWASSDDGLAPKGVIARAKRRFFAPKLNVSRTQGSIASTVHYSVTSRAELMGRAAGPVYNFSGKGAGQARSGQIAADNAAGAMQKVDAAQKELDASDASSGDKANIDHSLDGVRQSAGYVPAGQ